MNLPALRRRQRELTAPISSFFDSAITEFFKDFDSFGIDTVKGKAFPKIDIYTEKQDLVFEAAVPFIDEDKLDVHLDGNTLVISGDMEKTNEFKDRGYIQKELSRSSFCRTFSLPEQEYDMWSKKEDKGVEKVEADLHDGLLKIRLKEFYTTPEQEETRKVPISIRSGLPSPEDELDPPGFRLVTKGEKGSPPD
jgi:HSP20 family protein